MEPNYLVYGVPKPALDLALSDLKALLVINRESDLVVTRCRAKRIERIRCHNEAIDNNVGNHQCKDTLAQKFFFVYRSIPFSK